jgi:hypothetical protein
VVCILTYHDSFRIIATNGADAFRHLKIIGKLLLEIL